MGLCSYRAGEAGQSTNLHLFSIHIHTILHYTTLYFFLSFFLSSILCFLSLLTLLPPLLSRLLLHTKLRHPSPISSAQGLSNWSRKKRAGSVYGFCEVRIGMSTLMLITAFSCNFTYGHVAASSYLCRACHIASFQHFSIPSFA